jgi:hypothetical protein
MYARGSSEISIYQLCAREHGGHFLIGRFLMVGFGPFFLAGSAFFLTGAAFFLAGAAFFLADAAFLLPDEALAAGARVDRYG